MAPERLAAFSIYYLPNVGKLEQTGAITFRVTPEGPEFLLIRAKKNPDHWIFPKGHIEFGENAEATAVRELREEADVLGDIVEPLGTVEFRSGTETVRVQYFLCRFREQIDADEEREPQWCRPETAVELLIRQCAGPHRGCDTSISQV